MSENPIAISTLNDFIFCPVSIYFHSLEDETSILAQDTVQLNGKHAHRNSDSAAYSSKQSMLQGVSVYCEKYNLYGKIDTFDIEKGILTERKKKIKKVYDGYIFQLYAQYFALEEMGYTVNQIRLYSMDDNKNYNIKLPADDYSMLISFLNLIANMNDFSFETFEQENSEKCNNCIYEPLCSFSNMKGEIKSVYRT